MHGGGGVSEAMRPLVWQPMSSHHATTCPAHPGPQCPMYPSLPPWPQRFPVTKQAPWGLGQRSQPHAADMHTTRGVPPGDGQARKGEPRSCCSSCRQPWGSHRQHFHLGLSGHKGRRAALQAGVEAGAGAGVDDCSPSRRPTYYGRTPSLARNTRPWSTGCRPPAGPTALHGHSPP